MYKSSNCSNDISYKIGKFHIATSFIFFFITPSQRSFFLNNGLQPGQQLINSLNGNPSLGDDSVPKIEISKPTSLVIDFKKIGLWGGFGVAIIGVVFAFFIKPDLSQDPPVSPAIENNKALIELKNEIENLRENILDMQDDLYETIDLIEVSIHSFNKIRLRQHINQPRKRSLLKGKYARCSIWVTARLDPQNRLFFIMARKPSSLKKEVYYWGIGSLVTLIKSLPSWLIRRVKKLP